MLFYNTCPVYTGIDIDFYSLTTGFDLSCITLYTHSALNQQLNQDQKKKKEKKGGIDFIILISKFSPYMSGLLIYSLYTYENFFQYLTQLCPHIQ